MSGEEAYQRDIREAQRICEELKIPCTEAVLVFGAKCIGRGRELEAHNGLSWGKRSLELTQAAREAMSARARQLALMLPRKGESEHA